MCTLKYKNGRITFVEGCIKGDIDSCKTEFIEVPACMQTHYLLDVNEKERCQKTTNAPLLEGKQTDNVGTKRTKEQQNASSNALNGASTRISRVGKLTNITRTEREYLDLISVGIRDTYKIRAKRGCKIRVVQKTLKNLRKKGIINDLNEIVRFGEGSNAQSPISLGVTKQPTAKDGAIDCKKEKRLHGQQLWVKVHEKEDRYLQYINSTSPIDGNYVSLGRDVVQIGSNKDFYNLDPYIAFMEGLAYWYQILTKIENNYGVTLIKDQKATIRFVKAGEYGIPGHEVAIYAKKEGDKIKICGDDGLVWFECDDSFHLEEGECNHPREAQRDTGEVLDPFMNDLRRTPCTLGELRDIIKENAISSSQLVALIRQQQQANNETAEHVKETAAGTRNIISILKGDVKPLAQEESIQNKQVKKDWNFSNGYM